MGRAASIVVAVWLAAVVPARAQSDLWAQGVELRREGRDAEALAVFQRAHAEERSARTLAQVALAEQALGRWPQAALHLGQALATPDAWVQQNRGPLDAARAEIMRHVGQVEVLVDRAGAEIELDGQVVGRSPLPGPVPASLGVVALRVRMSGRIVAERSVSVRPGVLARESVVVGGGVAVGALPAGDPNAPPGRDSALPIAGWTLTGVGIAAAAGMGVAWGLREYFAAQWNDDSRCLVGTMTREQTCGSDRSAAESSELAAIVLGVSAAALLTLGLVLVGIGSSGGGESASLECAPGLMSVACRGRF